MDVTGEDFPCVHVMSVRQRWRGPFGPPPLGSAFFHSSAPCRLLSLSSIPIVQDSCSCVPQVFSQLTLSLGLALSGITILTAWRFPWAPCACWLYSLTLSLRPSPGLNAWKGLRDERRPTTPDSTSHRLTEGPLKKIRAKLWSIFSDRSNDGWLQVFPCLRFG